MECQHILQTNHDNLPLISVVIPVYNGENYLREAIESVLAQTYKNYEIIVVDDGSTDTTRKIIESYGDRVHPIFKENGGATSALNCGIKAMNGEWFAWLSHDDLWEPSFLSKQIKNLQAHPECMISYTGYSNINSERQILNKVMPIWYPKGKDLRHMIVYGEYTYGITVLINKRCFEDVGVFDKRWKYVQDTDMWFRLLRKYNACYIPELLAKRRVHPNQTGVLAETAFKNDWWALLAYYAKRLSCVDYYPSLIEKDTPAIKKKWLRIGCMFYYKKYIPFCYKYHLPITLKQYIWRLMIPNPLKHGFENLYKLFQRKYNDFKYNP